MKKKLIFKEIASWSVETEIIIEVELTKKEREENVRLLEEIVEAEFPFDEMADPTFRDKVLTFLFVYERFQVPFPGQRKGDESLAADSGRPSRNR